MDKTMEISGRAVTIKYKDMGDGTHAEVISVGQVTDAEGNPDPTAITFVEPLGKPAAARQLAATASSQATTLTSSCRRLSMFARTADIRYAIADAGSPTAVASATASHYIAAGERMDIRLSTASSIGVIRDSGAAANGVLEVTELE